MQYVALLVICWGMGLLVKGMWPELARGLRAGVQWFYEKP